MFQIRNLEDGDLEQIKLIDYMLWLLIQWNKCFERENTFVAVSEQEVLGVGALAYDGTWYYLDKGREDIPLYRMQIELKIKENTADEFDVKVALVNALKRRLTEYKKTYADKRLCIRCWCKDTEKEQQQFWLSQGFGAASVVWVLRFDLTKDIPTYPFSKDIVIKQHNFEGDGMKRYLLANTLGYDGVQDAEAELKFRLQDDRTVVFVAEDKDIVAASVTVWDIGDGRSATENVFTIPQYRRKNIGRATLSAALKFLKERGDKEATLTCVGDNIQAISMYFSMGYEVLEHMVEMHFEI